MGFGVYSNKVPGAGVGWDIDEHGEEIAGSRVPTDNYLRNLNTCSEDDPNRLPDPNSFHLGPLPPIVSP